MSLRGKNAYITGGASGIGAATARLLASKGATVMVADRNIEAANSLAESINKTHPGSVVSTQVNVTSWEQQVSAFTGAVKQNGRIDYVYAIAGIGEKRWLPKGITSETVGFVKPDLEVLDIDLKAVLYTISLAIQQFKKQSPLEDGYRGKIFLVGSYCGLYSVPTFPIYTAAKSALVGLTRAYGKYLPREGIALNIVCPYVVRTNISTDKFYEEVDYRNLLTPMSVITDGFEALLDRNESGIVMECGPHGPIPRDGLDFMDEKAMLTYEVVEARALPLCEL